MEKDLQNLLEQLDNARKDTRVIDRDKANNYYNAITNVQTQLKKKKEVIDKAIEWVYIVQQNKDNNHLEPIICTDELDELLDILKEVDKEVE